MNFQNIDSAIFKRVARLFKTHEFRVTLPEAIFEKTELVYNPKTGLDVASTASEGKTRTASPVVGCHFRMI